LSSSGFSPDWLQLDSFKKPSDARHFIGHDIRRDSKAARVVNRPKEIIMNSSYGWQKHQANEQIQARQREAEMHRMAKQAPSEREPWLNKSVLAFIVFMAFALVSFFL